MSARDHHLSEEEAFALLGLCMTSTQQLDPIAESAMRKLANMCRDFIPKTQTESSVAQDIV